MDAPSSELGRVPGPGLGAHPVLQSSVFFPSGSRRFVWSG
jgi:hypothetical protein